MSSNAHNIIAQNLGVKIGSYGLAPVLQKWGPVLTHKDAFSLVSTAVRREYNIDLPSIIQPPEFMEFMTDLLKGVQHVHNEYGASFAMLGFHPDTQSYDGHPTDAIYKPETNTVYVSALALAKYQRERDKDRQGKGEFFGTVNLPGLALPYRQFGLSLGLEEALHSVETLRPGTLQQTNPYAPVSIQAGMNTLDTPEQQHGARPEEVAIRKTMLRYAKELSLGTAQGQSKG